jgi:hypothetical protein
LLGLRFEQIHELAIAVLSIRSLADRRGDRSPKKRPAFRNPPETAMRFMIIVKATKDSEAGVMPHERLFAAMANYHEALANAGVLLDRAGLQPSAKGWRVQYRGGQRRTLDGPFSETAELIAGYTLIQVRSREEAMEWVRRFPAPMGEARDAEIEVRQLFEAEDFAPNPAIDRVRQMDEARE